MGKNRVRWTGSDPAFGWTRRMEATPIRLKGSYPGGAFEYSQGKPSQGNFTSYARTTPFLEGPIYLISILRKKGGLGDLV